MRQFDTHNDYRLLVNQKFDTINTALENFVAEMKALGIWDDVAIVTISDFGRKLVPNGRGSDHAWGGRYPSTILELDLKSQPWFILNCRTYLPNAYLPTMFGMFGTEGNYFVVGGGLRGGQVLGDFPSRLHPEHNDLDINNGRVIPTTPWEVIYSRFCTVRSGLM